MTASQNSGDITELLWSEKSML